MVDIDRSDQTSQNCWDYYKMYSLTLYGDRLTADNNVGRVDGFTEVHAAVMFGQIFDLEVCVIGVGCVGVQWIFLPNTVPLEGNRWCSLDTTYQVKMISLIDFSQGGDDGQSRV